MTAPVVRSSHAPAHRDGGRGFACSGGSRQGFDWRARERQPPTERSTSGARGATRILARGGGARVADKIQAAGTHYGAHHGEEATQGPRRCALFMWIKRRAGMIALQTATTNATLRQQSRHDAEDYGDGEGSAGLMRSAAAELLLEEIGDRR